MRALLDPEHARETYLEVAFRYQFGASAVLCEAALAMCKRDGASPASPVGNTHVRDEPREMWKADCVNASAAASTDTAERTRSQIRICTSRAAAEQTWRKARSKYMAVSPFLF